MPQRPTLFRGTVADNIRLGDAGRDRRRGAGRGACSPAPTRSSRRLPDGYDTIVGDGGRPLSAGERSGSRSRARFVRDAPLVILDEPTAEPRSGERGSSSARRSSGCDRSRTVLLIAHRPELAAPRRPDRAARRRARPRGARRRPHDGDARPPARARRRPAAAASRSPSALGALDGRLRRRPDGDRRLPDLARRRAAGDPVARRSRSSRVRFFGLARPLARYLERLASHDLALRVARRACACAFYERIEPLAPAQLEGYRHGDLLDADGRRRRRAAGPLPARPSARRSSRSSPARSAVGGRPPRSCPRPRSSSPPGCSSAASRCPWRPAALGRARPRAAGRRARRAVRGARRAARAARPSSSSTAREHEPRSSACAPPTARSSGSARRDALADGVGRRAPARRRPARPSRRPRGRGRGARRRARSTGCSIAALALLALASFEAVQPLAAGRARARRDARRRPAGPRADRPRARGRRPGATRARRRGAPCAVALEGVTRRATRPTSPRRSTASTCASSPAAASRSSARAAPARRRSTNLLLRFLDPESGRVDDRRPRPARVPPGGRAAA